MYNLVKLRHARRTLPEEKLTEQNDNPAVTEPHHEQLRFAHGLARCSQILLRPAESEEEKLQILGDALEQVRQATNTSRAFLYRNFEDPELGLCSGGVAVAADPKYPPDSTVPWLVSRIPWSSAPQEARHALQSGRPYGGTLDTAFASTPDFQETLREDGVLSVQFFPIHIGDQWWGYVGFDEREHAREWQSPEIVLLRTAAEMFANALQRWQHEAELDRRGRYEEALNRCARVLHQVTHSENEQVAALTQALEYLRRAVDVGRAYLFENFVDSELGDCLGMRAETCAPGVHAQIDNPANRRMPWSALPSEMLQALDAQEPFGGPVDSVFASRPEWITIFKGQKNPLLSIQLFPIHFGGHWWGFVGFDDVQQPREWSPAELRVLRVAAEMIGNTLRRWQTETALRAELEERRRREERLRLLESVVVNTSEGVLITAAQPLDPPGPPIVYVNDAFSRMTGYGADELIGKNPRVLQGAQTSRQELDRLRMALESQEQVDVELINYRKDGSKFWVEISVAPVFDDEGNCTHFVAVQRDVTERKRAQAALEVSKEELEARVAHRTRQILRANEQLHHEIIARRQAEADVRQRLAVEETLADLSMRLVEETDPRAIMPDVLHDVATMIAARRVALVFLSPGAEQIGDLFEWHSPDTPPLERSLLASALPTFARMRTQLEDRQSVFIGNLRHPPVTATDELQGSRHIETQSIALFPLHIDGKLEAVLVSSNFATEESPLNRQLDILKVIAGLLQTALQREALLNSLEQRAIDRTRELAAFYDMTMLAAEAENLSDILQPALTQIMEAARCQAISVHEVSDDGEKLHLVAEYGLGLRKDAATEVLSERLGQWFARLHEPIIEQLPNESEWLPAALRPAGFSVYIGAQLRARGKALGILICYRREDRMYSLNTTALVVALAEQLGIVVENYRLRQRAEEGAIIEERRRLARDLHDAITQSLYSVSLFARSSADALEAGELDKAAMTVAEVEETALRMLREMRLLLHQLQPLVLEQGGLAVALQSRLNQVERRLGIQATLDLADAIRLRPRAEEALYRIITEALNNSLKHADASEVRVKLYVRPKEEQTRLRVEVRDNGRGFDTDGERLGLGIKNMEARVALLGGKFTLRSKPGEGTVVAVDLPAEWLE